MGRLHLKANQIAEALKAFTHAARLESNSEKIINHLWNIFRAEKKYSEFLQFCDQQLPETTGGGLRELVRAQALSELEQYTLAFFNLEKIPQTSRYRAEGYYLAAGIFEKNKDWDQMELAAHQATVLDSKNSAYHLRFSTALKQKKKFPQAEEAADRAVAASEKSQAWLHNHRAWIRWQRNNISGAIEDWDEAIRLKPGDPSFYYFMALAHERLNDKASAIKSLQQALQLKPNDAQYLEKMAKLQKTEKKP
jgi:tetratricopeptide (TPR) repeat protein